MMRTAWLSAAAIVVFHAPAAAQDPPENPPAEEQPEPSQIEVLSEDDALERAGPEPKLTNREVRQIPGTFGDPFRAIEIMPGVTPIFSGIPYFYVRGAPPGNVGYFLDGVRVPGLFHLAVGPAVIHPRLIDTVTLHPGGYPAVYGGYAGAIVAGETAPPAAEITGEAGIRPIDASAFIDAPLFDGQLSLSGAGRISFVGPLLHALTDTRVDYRDYQLRVAYTPDPRHRLSLFWFGSYDSIEVTEDDGDIDRLSVEFHRIDLRYDHDPETENTTRVGVTVGADRTAVTGGFIRNRTVGTRVRALRRLNDRLLLDVGSKMDLNVDDYLPDISVPIDGDGFEDILPFQRDLTVGGHAALGIAVTPAWQLTVGMRGDMYTSNGVVRPGIDPRVQSRVHVLDWLDFFHAHGLAHQPPSFVIPIPGFAVLGLEDGLQRSLQNSAGVEVALPAHSVLTLTGFRNAFFDMTDAFGVGDDFLDAFTTRSIGSSYGLEVHWRRPLTHRVGGFVSYTLSRSQRSYGDVTGPSRFDRTHVLAGAISFDFGSGWRFGTRTTFYTGIPAQYDVENVFDRGTDASDRPERTFPFFRIDGRLEKRWIIADVVWLSFVIEVLNATFGREMVSLSCGPTGCNRDLIGPITVPSIGVEAGF